MRQTTDPSAVDGVSKREIKTAKDLRVAIAEHDVPLNIFAQMAGVPQPTLSAMMHNRSRITRIVRLRVEQAMAQLDDEAARLAAAGVDEDQIPRTDRYPRIRRL